MDDRRSYDLYLTSQIKASLELVELRVKSLSDSIKKEAAMIKVEELQAIVAAIEHDICNA